DSSRFSFRPRRSAASPLCPLLRAAVADDHRLGPLVVPRLVTLRRHAPRRHRMTTARRAALAAAVRMIHRVHRDAAHRRTDAPPALRARLTELAQAVLVVTDLADRGAAIHVHLAHLAGSQAKRHVGTFPRDDLHRSARAARELTALTGLELDAMDLRTDRDIPERHRVARLDRHVAAGLDRVADPDVLRREDVAPLAVRVEDQREVRAAVRVVFQPLDAPRNAVLVALEIDDPIVVLVAAAAVANGHTPLIVAAAGLRQRHDEGLVRRPLVQRVVHDAHREPLPGGRRLELT